MTAGKQIRREGPFKSIIPDGVLVGNIIYLSGHVSVDDTGKLVGKNDMSIQINQIYDNVKRTLGTFDAQMADIVDETVFTTDIDLFLDDRTKAFEIRRRAFAQEPETSQTLVQVARLANRDWLVEIKCVAHLPDEKLSSPQDN
ncbi:MAG: hypothetical protein CMO06_17850 [Thalassospira sp.]|uniref:RidA family protein n=1 Tax=Thalassospira sp. TaxID=1912094 RepID=UPI000C3C4AD1|nr:RidA family protein [Thalassospira sp.]MAZ35008.1 hypothetical protein [Thalassospira sp.]|tara:strand:- start:352 stop:780 length:429 start_codon:yes stop_codon:yes gene_type:complete